jgi:hypothetical protein
VNQQDRRAAAALLVEQLDTVDGYHRHVAEFPCLDTPRSQTIIRTRALDVKERVPAPAGPVALPPV